MLNILVVDDEKNIRHLIKRYLEKQNMKVYEAEDGLEGLNYYQSNQESIDLIIMDIMMPNMDGLTASSKIREFSDVPIIMLTAKTQDEDEIKGLKNGANDYIDKPFNLEVLLLRIKKLTKNEKDLPFVLSEESKTVIKNGRVINLTNIEYKIIEYLFNNPNIVLSRDKILDAVWGMDFFGDDRIVDTNIKRLRKKVDPEKKHIKTYRGVGYVFTK